MARTVDEIMNREVLAVRLDTPLREVRELLRAFAVGAVPVLDGTRRPLGVVSCRDALEGDGTAGDRMSRPAICVANSATIEHAARQLACTDRHHLLVVDGAGVVAGMLSSLDLLRALLGAPVHHPGAFPHWDDATRVSWTDDWPLDEPGCAHAPDVPGFLLLVSGEPGERDQVVFAEPCASVRKRALELATSPLAWPKSLAQRVSRAGLHFRAAAVFDESEQHRIGALLRDRLAHVPPPGAT